MINYFTNILQDIYYGYIEVKCCNNNCNQVFKISRNKYKNTLYSCNTGCALAAYNHLAQNDTDNKY